MIIINSKRIQNAYIVENKGYYAGIRLHIGVDILGFSHLIMITTADVTDHNGAIDMVDYYCDNTENLYYVKKILVDEGYTGQNFAVIPKRSFGLSNKCR